MTSDQKHWDDVYISRRDNKMTWHEDRPCVSLEMIAAAGIPSGAAAIDIGAGAGTLATELASAGFATITALDLSKEALERAKINAEARAKAINWVVGDVRDWTPDQTYDLWHDRATYHFLTEDTDRQAYLATMTQALRVGGCVIIAGFALDGPEKCSGLPVRRHSQAMLVDELGSGYELKESRQVSHRTPMGADQAFIYCRFEKLSLQGFHRSPV